LHSYGVGGHFETVATIIDGNGCVTSVGGNLDYICMGKGIDVVDSIR
jgi:hypothetical protein